MSWTPELARSTPSPESLALDTLSWTGTLRSLARGHDQTRTWRLRTISRSSSRSLRRIPSPSPPPTCWPSSNNSAGPARGSNVVRLQHGEAGLSARTIKRRISTVSGLFSYLMVRGDIASNPVPRGLATRRALRGGDARDDAVAAGPALSAEGAIDR